jgi:hypothetical protein
VRPPALGVSPLGLAALAAAVLIAFASTPAHGQRWIEYDQPGAGVAFRPVAWDSVAAVVIDTRRGSPGIALHAVGADGRVRLLGTAAVTITGAARLRALLASQPARWIRAWPALHGAYVGPPSVEAFVDLCRVTSFSRVTPRETGGRKVWRLTLTGGPAAIVVDDAQQARVRELIGDSMKP